MMTNPTTPIPAPSFTPEDFASQASQGLIEQNAFVTASFMPKVLRVLKIEYHAEFTLSPCPIYRALLFADGVKFAVEWVVKHEYIVITPNQLVTMLFNGPQAKSVEGYLQIEGLHRLDRPDTSFSIFHTAPLDWFANHISLRQKAQEAWELLDDKNRGLINAVLFEGDLFKRFCKGPSSTSHHHNYLNGNIEHTLEVVFNVAQNMKRYPSANEQLTLVFAWLHDVGKADEYNPTFDSEDPSKSYKLTSDGFFHGHKMNGLNLIVKAQLKYLPSYPVASFDNLRHLMEATVNSGSSGFRPPQMLEHLLVSNADSASAAANLYARAYRPGQSWGMAPDKSLNFRYEV